MPVVRGDKIGESRRLTRCSIEAADFFASMVSHEVPDDFGRFRLAPHLIHGKMYPRREPTAASLRRVERLLRELGAAGLWRTWTQDDVVFAEVYNWIARGNLYHRTPEPPPAPSWAAHRHSRRCATTAHARAVEWGDADSAVGCLRLIKGLPWTDPEQMSSRPRANVEHPSVPSVPSVPTDNGSPPIPPAGAGGDFEVPPDLDDQDETASDPLGPQAQGEVVEKARRYAIEQGLAVPRDVLRAWKGMARGHRPAEVLEHLKVVIDEQKLYGRSLRDRFCQRL